MNCDDFDGVVCRRMYNSTNHLLFYGWKASMLYSRGVYGGHWGTKNARCFVFGKEGFL